VKFEASKRRGKQVILSDEAMAHSSYPIEAVLMPAPGRRSRSEGQPQKHSGELWSDLPS